MPVAQKEATVSSAGIKTLLGHETFPVLREHSVSKPERRSGILVVGGTTIFHNISGNPIPSFQPETTQLNYTERMTLPRVVFNRSMAEATGSGAHFLPPVYGHAVTIGNRLDALLNGNGVTPVNVVTWTNPENAGAIRRKLKNLTGQQHHHVREAEGEMPEILVYSAEGKSGTERFALGTSSDIPSTFDSFIDGSHEHIIIGALYGSEWRAYLRRGLDRIQATTPETPFTIMLGPEQWLAASDGEGSDVLYEAIAKATNLVVTKDELMTLIAGKKSVPEESEKDLLKQALTILRSKNIFVTMGTAGAIGASKENGIIAKVKNASPNTLVTDEDYRDAFVAGLFKGNSLEDRLCSGSISASFVSETTGENEHVLTEIDLAIKMMLDKPNIEYI